MKPLKNVDLTGLRSSIFIFLAAFGFLTNEVSAQSGIDSLESLIRKADDGTDKVHSLIELSGQYLNQDLNEAVSYAQEAVRLSQQIGYPKGTALAYKAEGMGYYFLSENVNAVTAWQNALNVFEEIGDSSGVSNMNSNIGAVYYSQGAYTQALEYYLEGLRIGEAIKDTLRQLTPLTNIGAIYSDNIATHDKALEYAHRALEMSEAIDDRRAIATNSVNLGEIYLADEKDSLALDYFERSMKNMEEVDGISHTLVSVSKVYNRRGDHDKALEALNEAIQLADSINSKGQKAHAITFLGETYRSMGEDQLSIEAYKEAEKLLLEVNDLKDLENTYNGLNLIYSGRSEYDSAYKYQTLYNEVQRKAYDIEVDKVVRNKMLDFQVERKQNEINFLEKEAELKELDLKRQKVIRNLIAAGFISVIIFLLVVVRQKRTITIEKNRSEKLLLNILPYEVAEELKEKGSSDAQTFSEVSVLFTDFKGFTSHSEKLTAADLVREINEYFKAFDEIVHKYNIEKIKTIGDAYMAAGGVPMPTENGVVDVILAAMEMQEFVEQRKVKHADAELEPFSMRAGVHTGQVVAGIVGVKKFQYDIWGDTVNTASRMESNGGVGEVNISEPTYEVVKKHDFFTFEKREPIEVKGKGEMQMYFVRLKPGLTPNAVHESIKKT